MSRLRRSGGPYIDGIACRTKRPVLQISFAGKKINLTAKMRFLEEYVICIDKFPGFFLSPSKTNLKKIIF